MSNLVINIAAKLEALGSHIEQIKDATIKTIQTSIETIAYATKTYGIQLSQERLHKTGPDWRSGFDLQKLDDNIYIITLSGDYQNELDSGYDSFDMKPGILSGSNSKTSKDGSRYAVVPFHHQPYSQVPANKRVQDLRDAVKVLIKERGLDKIIKDPKTGNTKTGPVARITNTGIKDLERLTKYQKTYNNTTKSYYMTFRTVSSKQTNKWIHPPSEIWNKFLEVSSKQTNKWIHPGFRGVHIMEELEKFAEQQIDEVLSKIDIL